MIIAKQKSRNLAMMLVMVMLFGLLPMTSPLVAEATDKGPYITVTGKVYDHENGVYEGKVTEVVYEDIKITIQNGLKFTVSEAVYLEAVVADGYNDQVAIVKQGEDPVTENVYNEYAEGTEFIVTGNPGEAVKVKLTSVSDENKKSEFTFVIGEEKTTEPDPKEKYAITFIVTPEGATIKLGEETVSGTVYKEAGTYDYTVSKEGYKTATGNVTIVDADVKVTVDLVKEEESVDPVKKYTVTFEVEPKDATITFGGQDITADKKVQVNEGTTYTYKVSKEGYETKTGEITPDQDITIEVVLTKIGIPVIEEVEVKDGKVDLSAIEELKPDKDGKTKPVIVPIKVGNLSIKIQLPALNLGNEKAELQIKEVELEGVTKTVTVLEIIVPGNDGKVLFTLTLPVPSGLENKSIAGFHKSGNRWEYRKAARQDNNAIFDTNLSAVAVGEAVEIPEIKKVVSTTKNSVTLEVYSTVKDATFEFFAGNNKLTANKVNDKDNQYSITGLAASTTYDIKVRAIDKDGFESDLSQSVKITTDKKSSSGSSSSGGGGGSSSSTNKVNYNKSATVESRGAKIEFPANALNQDFEVEITRVSSTSRLPMPSNMKFAGDVFEITKNVDGDFDKDVTITLPYDKSKVDFDKYDVSLFWLNEKTDKWVELDDIRVNKSSETVRGEVDHFTKFAVLAIEKGTEIEKDDEVEEIVLSLRDIKGHWAETHITNLIENGAISGYPDGTFKPDNNITRAEFATVLVKALDLEETTGKVFNDTANHWARKYIATAEANGIVSGYSTTTFGADDLITREQMAVMIVKAAKLSNTTPYTEFADAKKISSWAKPAVDTASYNDIIKGYPDGTFGPQKSATRAEAVTVIGKIL